MKLIVYTRLFLVFLFTLLVFVCRPDNVLALGVAKIAISVLDEQGKPVEGARVGIGFDNYRSSNGENSVIGITDTDGIFAASEATTSGFLGFNVTTVGYYKSTGYYQFKKEGEAMGSGRGYGVRT
jgi:hypothetical protein